MHGYLAEIWGWEVIIWASINSEKFLKQNLYKVLCELNHLCWKKLEIEEGNNFVWFVWINENMFISILCMPWKFILDNALINSCTKESIRFKCVYLV